MPAVVIPAPLCALLDSVGLSDIRKRERGNVSDLDAVLHAIHVAGLSYVNTLPGSASGTSLARPPEPAALSGTCGVSEASGRLAITTRAVRRAATEGRLTGELVDGRWLFSRSAVEAFRANRAL